MTRTTYTCDGCGTQLDNEKDIQKSTGTIRPDWQCRTCGTTVPSVVAERISHQKQNATE
ncbi:hypothetical protein [Halapricum desulfuricans]|uniref:Uncharacterized protein n=2 Tax=Halapricum desulfuricans TaxID=2841257 RepID=A0ACD6B552_9EURY|nr:hypothetical protein [Halapricum desulfuricans]QSG10344.1 Uncharacterized protein HSR122_2975 [Halapricum desulfuricans]QSG13609.1 Uncharacterized protein HSEST_0046 [Halapricum desulfuricans]